MPEVRGTALRTVEIADDDRLVERYGERIPVLAVGDQELEWPFAAPDVVRFVAD